MNGRTNSSGTTINDLEIPLDPCINLVAVAGNGQVSLTWTDPKDKYATPEGEAMEDTDQLVSVWAYTTIVRKAGSASSGPNDGTLITSSSIRDQYKTENYIDSTVENDVTYYYTAYAYNKENVPSEGATSLGVTTYTYSTVGVKIALNDSNPETSVVYTDDAEGVLPSYYTTDEFIDNGWTSRIQRICGMRPCLLKNGVVNYYLDPNDYTKKIDGTAADITSGNDGDVMIEFDHCYTSIYKDSNFLYVKLSQSPGENFVDYAFYGTDMKPKNKMYIGVYPCSSGYKSLSGKTILKRDYDDIKNGIISSRGEGYYSLHYIKLCFLQILYIIRFKNLNSIPIVGEGNGQNKTGLLNTSGLYYSDHQEASSNSNKFDGIENLFTYNTYTALADMYEPGAPSWKYNFYIDYRFNSTEKHVSSTSAGYVKSVYGTNEDGFIAILNSGLNGSSSTYFCSRQRYWYGGCGAIGNDTEYNNGGKGVFGTSIASGGSNFCSRLTYCGGGDYES